MTLMVSVVVTASVVVTVDVLVMVSVMVSASVVVTVAVAVKVDVHQELKDFSKSEFPTTCNRFRRLTLRNGLTSPTHDRCFDKLPGHICHYC